MAGRKRLLFTLLVLMLPVSLCLAGCNGESPAPAPSPEPAPAPVEPVPSPVPSPSPLPPVTELPPDTPDPGPSPSPSPTISPGLPPPPPPVSPETPEVTWAADGIISPGEYPIAVEYQDWQVAWHTDAAYAYFGIRAKTGGYVALGIQPGRTMKDADMIFGYVAGEAVTVLDMFSTGSFGPHPADTAQGGTDDILAYGGAEAGGFTTIEFKRALVTGDAFDLPLNPGVNKIIWAYGSADSPGGGHSSRGYGEINLE